MGGEGHVNMHGRHYRNMLTHAHGPRGSPFLHDDKLHTKPMEAVDPATENSICEAGIMRKQDQNDSAKFYEKNCHDDRKKRGFRLIAVRVFTYT